MGKIGLLDPLLVRISIETSTAVSILFATLKHQNKFPDIVWSYSVSFTRSIVFFPVKLRNSILS